MSLIKTITVLLGAAIAGAVRIEETNPLGPNDTTLAEIARIETESERLDNIVDGIMDMKFAYIRD